MWRKKKQNGISVKKSWPFSEEFEYGNDILHFVGIFNEKAVFKVCFRGSSGHPLGESIDFPYDKSKEIVMADGIKRSMKKGCVYCDKTGDSNVITEDDAPSANLLGAAYALPDKQTVACFNPKTNGKLTLTVSGWRKNIVGTKLKNELADFGPIQWPK